MQGAGAAGELEFDRRAGSGRAGEAVAEIEPVCWMDLGAFAEVHRDDELGAGRERRAACACEPYRALPV